MLKIGLIGGIGSGKTTVANYFKEFGIHVIDSDQIAKQLTDKNQPAYLSIYKRYGGNILCQDDQINRRKLRSIIFSDSVERRWLEDLLHPLIRQTIQSEIALSHSPYCILVIPLLIETSSYDLVDRILLVDSTIDQQIKRTMQRDKTIKKYVINIIKNQASRKARIRAATEIIFNDGSLAELKNKTYQHHLIYLKMAS
jgi:dephospho-CoA kinase